MSYRLRQMTVGLVLSSTVASLLFGVFGFASSASAATVNVAVKGTGSAIYWVAQDGKKYLVPNADVWYTWFPDFKNVKKITNTELSKLSTGGRVTMRPGAKLVKFGAEADVYAVSRYSVLRPITNATVASTLYGSNWTSLVKTMPSAFKADYSIGGAVQTWNTWEYNVSQEYNAVNTPSDNMGKPSLATSGTLTTYTNNTQAKLGDVQVVTTKFAPSGLLTDANGFLLTIYDQYGAVLKQCANTTTCETTYTFSNNGSAYRGFYSTLDGNGQRVFSNAFNVTVDLNTWQNNTNTFSITTNKTNLVNGEGAVLTVNHPATLPYDHRIEIQRVNAASSNTVHTCYGTICSTTVYPTDANATYRAVVYNNANQAIEWSTYVTMYVSNTGTQNTFTGSPVLNYTTWKDGNGDTWIRLTADVYNMNVAYNQVTVQLMTAQTNSQFFSCAFIACSTEVNVGKPSAGTTFQYFAIIRDAQGRELTRPYATVTIPPTIPTYPTPPYLGQLTLITDKTTIAQGETANITAYTNTVSIPQGWKLEILTSATTNKPSNFLVATCQLTTCSATASWAGDFQSGRAYWAELLDQNGNLMAKSAYVSIAYKQVNPSTITLTATNLYPIAGQSVTLSAMYGATLPAGWTIKIKSASATLSYDVQTCSVNPCLHTFVAGNGSTAYNAYVYNAQNDLVAWTNAGTLVQSGQTVNPVAEVTGVENLWYNVNGNSITITNRLDNSNVPMQNLYADIYDVTSMKYLGLCDRTNTCSVTMPDKSTISGHLIQAIWTDERTWKSKKSMQVQMP